LLPNSHKSLPSDVICVVLLQSVSPSTPSSSPSLPISFLPRFTPVTAIFGPFCHLSTVRPFPSSSLSLFCSYSNNVLFIFVTALWVCSESSYIPPADHNYTRFRSNRGDASGSS
jgi:hypothetical protein